jgi:hypothetical protein
VRSIIDVTFMLAGMPQLQNPMVIHVYHPYRQPDGENYCQAVNGHCSHLCLPAPQINFRSPKISCACPDGLRLLADGLMCGDEGTYCSSVGHICSFEVELLSFFFYVCGYSPSIVSNVGMTTCMLYSILFSEATWKDCVCCTC